MKRIGAGSMKSDERRAIVAALVWDRPTLQAVRTPEAKAFIAALARERMPSGWDSEDAGDSPLGLAAAGLQLVMEDEREAARTYFEVLSERRDLASLLGWSLLAWMGETPGRELEAAGRVVRRQRDVQLRARLWCKLAAIALDKGYRDTAKSFMLDASRSTSPSTRLGLLIRLTGANEFGTGFAREIKPTRDTDELADLPWVSLAAEDAGREALEQLVLSASRRASVTTIRFGRPVVDKIAAAEMQATWAGALWLRRKLRLQLASTLLSGGASSPAEWAYGCAMWVLGHGSNVSSILDAAERHFDVSSGDVLLNDYLRHFGVGPWEEETYFEVLGSLWDLISDDTAAHLVRSIPLPEGFTHLQKQRWRVLGVLALRSPAAWKKRWSQLTGQDRLRIATAMAPAVLARLPDDEATALLEVLRTPPGPPEFGEDYFRALAALLSRRPQDEEAMGQLAKAPPIVLSEIALRYPRLIASEVVRTALRQLVRQVVNERRRAEQRTWSVGGSSTPRALGVLASATGDPRQRVEAAEVLLKVVASRRVPQSMRVDAAIGLWSISSRHGLSRRMLAELRRLDPASLVRDLIGGDSPELFQAAVLGALSPSGLLAKERDMLIAHSRDPDPIVRRTAIRAAATEPDRSAVSPALLAGLFDPDTDVLVATIEAVRSESRDSKRSPSLPGLHERLLSLFRTSGRDVRAKVVYTAKSIPSPSSYSGLKTILADAKRDRSWIVRDAARR